MAVGPEDSVVVSSEETHHGGEGGGVDAAFAKRVLRKIDMRLVPLLFVTYMLNFMDKTILSSASVFGLQDDTVGFLIFSFHLPNLLNTFSLHIPRKLSRTLPLRQGIYIYRSN